MSRAEKPYCQSGPAWIKNRLKDKYARYLVMRYSPMIGRPNSPRRVDVACWCYSLSRALSAAGAGLPYIRKWFWIVKAGAPAHVSRARRVKKAG